MSMTKLDIIDSIYDNIGISAVPTFAFNHQTVVGAQSYEVLEQFLRNNGIKSK
jgi:predicted DsbA family dithiol-disulfide isomerase